MNEFWERIKSDPHFHKECAAAERKAQKVADRFRDKIMKAEEKEIERHRKVMAEISRKQRSIFKEVYGPIYDPLEEAAYARAEARIRASTPTSQP